MGCAEETTDSQNRVRVQNVSYKHYPSGARILTGDVVNLSLEEISIAQIQISLFDADNRRVDELNVIVRNLAPDTVTSFREPIRSEFDIRGARPKRVFIP